MLVSRLIFCLGLAFFLAISSFSRVAWADDRRFAQTLCVEFVNEYILPVQDFEGTTVGGLSALTYDRKTGHFYALSDQHGSGEAHFYQLDLEITAAGIESAQVQAITYLSDENGDRYSGDFDPEGIALTSQGSLFVSSEGNPATGLGPGLTEFERESGRQVRSLPIPERFLPAFEDPAETSANPQRATEETETASVSGAVSKPQQIRGVQANRGFESLTLGQTGTAPGEPLSLFTATEGPLVQDKTAASVSGTPRERLLHYYLGEGRPLLLGEYVYELDASPASLFHGLSEILAIDGSGHFLSLERALTPLGFEAKLFQFTLAGASDVSNRPALRGRMFGVQPMKKQKVMNLAELDLKLDNLEGMTWGPRLADGSRSLILISDDNFKSFEKTQLLLFKVNLS